MSKESLASAVTIHYNNVMATSTSPIAPGDTISFETALGNIFSGVVYSVSQIRHTLVDDGTLYGVECADGECYDVRESDVRSIR